MPIHRNFFSIIILACLMMETAWGVETITLLDRGEPYPSMIAHSGVFWVGQSRKQFNVNYRLEVYNPDGHLIDSVVLSHSLSVIKKSSGDSVVITGINPLTHLTEYTFAKLQNGEIHFKTTQINVDGFISFWVGSLGNRHYFADMGGNPNDTTTEIGLPAQTIFSAVGSSPHYLATRVRMPLAGAVINGKLIIVSSEGFSLSAGSLVEVDPITSVSRVILASKTAKFREIESIPGTDTFLTLASGENKLLVIDRTTGTIRREFPTIGYSRALNLMGHCAIVGNDETNTIEVFDLNSKESKADLIEKIELPIEEFSGIKQIATDETTGTVFARANFACNPLLEVCDKDFNRVITFGPRVGETIRNLCR